jgi:NAD(P)-dependent dehydrogenase (short-subunit alcohol dehydrogenase family)
MKSPGAVFVGKNLTYGFEVTQDGFESHIGVNHIAHVYLTKLLTQKLKESAPSRVVAVSSSAEEFAFAEGIRFDQWQPTKTTSSSWSPSLPPPDEDGLAYGQSKLANLLFVRELAKQLDGSGVTAYSCHPGVIQTELFRYLESKNEEDAKLSGTVSVLVLKLVGAFFNQALFLPEDGALTQLQLATSPPEQLVNGAFYHPIGRVQNSSHPQGQNETLPSILWGETERVILSIVGSF